MQLIDTGTVSQSGVDDRVVRSWARSLAAGLSPIGRLQCQDNLDAAALARVRAHSHDLISHSGPVMEYLFEQVRKSHSMVILADAQGMLMHTLGDLDFLDKAQRVALNAGACWAENARGTNAIGTALAERRALEVHGAEHFVDRHGFLTCAAAPIFSSVGELMGILDISGEQGSRHPHTLGLVATAAQMIENSLVLATCRERVLLRVHARAEGIGSVAEGVLAFDPGGLLVGANSRGLDLLGLRQSDIGCVMWANLFEHDIAQLLGRDATRELALSTVQGRSFHARLQQPGSSAARVVVPELQQSDALGRLDTGDLRWRQAADKARRVVDKAIPLLVLGESGVGKELFAQAVHASSRRRHAAFVALNCAAMPETLIESELFGYLPGAFTGASRQGGKGRIRDADGGTLFLDEIGDMPLPLQARLLRVLQERKVTPLGSSMAHDVDFTLICATNRNLVQLVEQGQFRQDLYYRINGICLQLPALRERSDLDALTARLLHELAPDGALRLSDALLPLFARHPWPGNLRQYAQALKTAVALLDPDENTIGWAHLPDDLVVELHALESASTGDQASHDLESIAQRAIRQTLETTQGNVAAASRQLGISRQTLYRKLGRMRKDGTP